MKHILRKSFLLLSTAVLVLTGCDKSAAELEELRSEFASLADRVAAIENTQIKALEEQIASIEKEVASLKGADKVLSEDVSVLEGKMSVVSADLATVKESVSALDSASEELSGEIETINAKLTQMESKISSILTSIDELKTKVDSSAAALTLSYITKYTDNNERVLYTRAGLEISGTATMSFTVRPASAAQELAKNWETSLGAIAVCTLTKGSVGESVDLSVSGASAKDGVLSVSVAVDKLGKDFILGNVGAALALDVTFGGATTVTDYVNLTPTMETQDEKYFITYLLKNFDTDGDGQVNADKVAELYISYDLTPNDINTIVSQAPALETLHITHNKLTSLDLSNNPALTTLECRWTSLTSIDLSNNPALTKLDCSDNKLTSLDLSNNPALTTLDCSSNNLTSIDLSKNEKLTSVNLTGNSDLTRVVCKSLDWALGCSTLSSDATALYYLSDGTQITLDSLTMVIDGKTWKQFNVEARLGNVCGNMYTFDNAQTACPSGWRIPTKDELTSLIANYSGWTTYGGVEGRWFSGNQPYSSMSSAIFLPVLYNGYSYGHYWSSTEYGSYNAYCLLFGTGYISTKGGESVSDVYVKGCGRSYELSVRCLKD